MMKLLDTTPGLFTAKEADRIAAELQAGDPEWTYKAEHPSNGIGLSRVAVLDEDGIMAGYWNSHAPTSTQSAA